MAHWALPCMSGPTTSMGIRPSSSAGSRPASSSAAVIGVPDSEGLTKTKAFVVLKDGENVDDAALKHFVKDRLAPYKYPRAIEFVAELPKTATGKIQRFKLREMEQRRV